VGVREENPAARAQDANACSNVEERTLQRRVKRAVIGRASAPVDGFLGTTTENDHHGYSRPQPRFAYAALEGPLFHGRADNESGRTRV